MTHANMRVESFLAGAFIATVSVWCVSAVLTLVFLSWGALIAYGYAALVAGALAIAENFSIVSTPRLSEG